MRTAEKKLFLSLAQAKSLNNKKLKQEENEEERATLRWFNSNITSQLEGLSFYVKPRVKRQSKQINGEKQQLYAFVLPAGQKSKQKRIYKKKRRKQGTTQREFTLQDFLALSSCFVKDFIGNEYLVNRALYHFDEQFAVNRETKQTVDKIALFQNARNIRQHDNTVIASRKSPHETLRFIS
ncbi:hypothetical protein HCA69_16305 [Listeria grandensis]|uniref:Uncharacterized protein n=1 Tax=Listeria grandensis TaxID=1494963 RepID=A0A7X0Y6I8_9LIST|nr:hypothetical protein [Listeria grandensis]MBC1937925.1 hypothetical protein [Listeria grandensis]